MIWVCWVVWIVDCRCVLVVVLVDVMSSHLAFGPLRDGCVLRRALW